MQKVTWKFLYYCKYIHYLHFLLIYKLHVNKYILSTIKYIIIFSKYYYNTR